MLFRRSWLTGPLLLALSLPLTAAEPEPLRFRLTGDPATLDWNLAQSSHETYVIMNLMEGLVEEGADLKARPALAEKWDVSDDGRTYVFTLRSGVKWSDGRALKASDFVDSWIRLLSPATRASYASYLFDVENAEAFHAGKLKDAGQVGVKALDDSRLQVKLRRRVPYFLHIPTFWVTFPVRMDLIRKHGKSWASPGKIATLGPYRLGAWKKGKSLRLERNPAYRAAPAVARVEAVIESDDAKARRLFEAGKLDFLLDATTADLLKARAAGGAQGARAAQYPYLATYYLGFNVRKPALGDASIRKAIAAAVDRDAIPTVLQGGQQASPSFVPPGLDEYPPPSYQPLSLYEARGALTKAGYVEGRGFPKLSIWVEKLDGAEALGAFIVKSLQEKLGVSAEARVGSPEEYQKALAAGTADLFVRHWGADYPEASNFLGVFVSGAGTNATGWASREYDQLLEAAREAGDSKARIDAYLKAEYLLVQQEQVIVPLFYRRNIALLGPRVKELTISPLNYLFLKEVSLAAPK